MNAFLSKISQLESINDVILLSLQGEPLFHNQPTTQKEIQQQADHWNTIIEGLDTPASAEFLFDKGRYYLHLTAIGYLIIALQNETSLPRIKVACTSVQKKLSAPQVLKKVLLRMLSTADDMQKLLIIRELVPLADNEVASALISLLKKESGFQSQAKTSLLLHICQTLGYCSLAEAIDPLMKILHTYDRTGTNRQDDAIREAAQISIAQLKLDMPVEAESEAQNVATKHQVEAVSERNHGFSDSTDVQHVEELLKNGKKSSAISFITQLIETAALRRQFEKAEKLRDWLIQIDPMALMEIIRSAEIIEEEKSAAISNEHLTTWKKLVRALSAEEFSSLYHAMTPRDYTNGQMIAKQGESLSTLFFVDRGRVQLYAVSQGREIPLKTLVAGDILGIETFFEVSVWTVNAKSMGCRISLLPHKKLQDLNETHPALESKLIDFCTNFQSSNALFRKTNKTRRTFERKTISGRTTIILLDKQGNKTGMGAKGDLLDISKGGVSFCLHFSTKENASALLGQAIQITIRTDISVPSLIRSGVIVAVRCHDFIGNEYSLHVKFNKQADNTELQQVIIPSK